METIFGELKLWGLLVLSAFFLKNVQREDKRGNMVALHRAREAAILCLMFVIRGFAQDGIGFYVSPGLRVGWDSKGVTTIGGKISVGITSNTDLDYTDNFIYLNLTAGFKSPISGKAAALYDECNFLQIQLGTNPFKNAFLLGGGIGAVKFRKKDRVPRWAALATLSMGNLAFAEVDFFISRMNVINTDFGILGILPLPIYGYNLSFE